jgi:hypothetical protein
LARRPPPPPPSKSHSHLYVMSRTGWASVFLPARGWMGIDQNETVARVAFWFHAMLELPIECRKNQE